MKFTKDAMCDGTSLQGYIRAYYHQLVEVFGEPDHGPNANMDKVTAEWCLEFEDGTVATIYDWKEYETPMGLHRWHIGGKDYNAVDRVTDTFTQGAFTNA
jgi:hypothetical protein